MEVRITALEVNGTTILVKEAEDWMYEATKAGQGGPVREKHAAKRLIGLANVCRCDHDIALIERFTGQ